MEKIVILMGSKKDENLLNCLKLLFPECAVEVHERRTKENDENFSLPCPDINIADEMPGKYLSL